MLDDKTIEKQLGQTIDQLEVPNLGNKISGKVRDCYITENPKTNEKERILVASDRLSAFDVILTTIPYKGQLLTQLALYWFEETKDILPNHLISSPHPNVMLAQEVEIVPIEVVVRGYLAGSAWRDYSTGKLISGVKLVDGLKKSEKLPEPVITPSTKAKIGEHDEPISSAEILERGLVQEKLWNKICKKSLELFGRGTEKAAEQGLILVDTKYEFGLKNGELLIADEIHTQDSSRYWLADSYQERFERGEDPEMLDKEFVRRWLIEMGYMGEGTPPEITDQFRIETAKKYIEAYEKITGKEFKPKAGNPTQEIILSLS